MAVGDGVVWSEALPDNNTVANEIDDYNRDLRVGVSARMRREHIWPTAQTATNEAGHHNFITLQLQTAAPVMAGTTGAAIWVKSSDKGVYITDSAGVDSLIVSATAAATANQVLASVGATASGAWKGLTSIFSGAFGAWEDKSASYGAQQATADGFVVGYVTSAMDANLIAVYTDTNSNPTTIRQEVYWAGHELAVMSPVKKGHYWKIALAGTGTGFTGAFYWIPLGV